METATATATTTATATATATAVYIMTPTRPARGHPSFQNFRFRRRPEAVPFQQDVPPTLPIPVLPRLSNGTDDEVMNIETGFEYRSIARDRPEEEFEDGHNEDEDEGMEEEGEEGEEEEGGIEEIEEAMPPVPRITVEHYLAHSGRLIPNQTWIARATRQELPVEQQDPEIAVADPGAVPMEVDVPFDPAVLGLKEIGNLASWTVSSCKPGCGVDALRDDDTSLFWQSDGPQPHHLNIHFVKCVSIRAIRIFLDFEADESYTPTRISLLAGTGYHDLIPFSMLSFEQPKGWIDVALDHVGGGPDGKTLRAFLVQVKIVENHQNGKDTHVRGLKIYAKDERAPGALGELDAFVGQSVARGKKKEAAPDPQPGERSWLVEPDWMKEPELR